MGTPEGPAIFVCIVILLGAAVEGTKHCKTTTYSKVLEDKGIECYNGDCDDEGRCICRPCWSGKSCDRYRNSHQPIFPQRTYQTSLSTHVSEDKVIYTVSAIDDDARDTCRAAPTCPCSEVVYLMEGSNAGTTFGINSETGEIYVKKPSALDPGAVFKLMILARNKIYDSDGSEHILSSESNVESSCTLNIHVFSPDNSALGDDATFNAIDLQMQSPADGYDLHGENKYKYNPFGSVLADQQSQLPSEHAHLRKKRSTPAIPANVTFTLEKVGVNENSTEMRIGDKMDFQLTVHFPSGTTDMLVELFTPDGTNILMTVCDVKVASTGSNLASSKGTITPKLESLDGSKKYDRAILDLGTITNSGADSTNAASSQLLITWSAVMIDSPQVQDNSVYWVSAGAEYENENYIWVGQASFTAKKDLNTYTLPFTPKFNATGPTAIEIGASGVFSVDMLLPYPSATVTFDVFAPLNNSDVMSVCSVVLVGVGPSYMCYESSGLTHELTKKNENEGTGNWRGRLNLGPVTNTGVRRAGTQEADNRLSVEFVMHMVDNAANVGTVSQVGAAVNLVYNTNTNLIWAGTFSVTTSAKTATPTITPNPTFTMTTVSGNTAATDDVVIVKLDITIPLNTETDYELEVLMPYNNSAPRMSLCSVQVVKTGTNVPCFSALSPVYSSRNGGTIIDRAVYKLGRLKNTGHRTTAQEPGANTVSLHIAGTVIDHSLNTNGAEMWVTAGVKYASSKAVVVSNKITIGSSTAVSDNTTTPTFAMRFATPSDHVYIGGSADVRLEVTTTPGALYKPMDIEMILPYENDSLVLSVCRMEIVSVGKNLPCFDKTRMNLLVQYVAKPTGPKHYKAVLNPGTVCNIAPSGTNSSADDKFEISLCLKVENHINLATNATKRWVSGGLMYQSTHLWVGQIAIFSMTGPTPALSTPPYFDIIRSDNGTTGIDIGGHAIYHFYIKLPPYSTSTYRVTVDVSSKLHVCNLRILEAGRNLPCVDPLLKANYTLQTGSMYNKDGVLEFTASNIGSDLLVSSTTKDSNTLIVAAVVQLPDKTTSVSSSHTINAKLYYDSQTLTKSATLSAVTPTAPNTTAANKPSFSLTVGPDYANVTRTAYAKGETIRYYLDITLQRDSMIKMLVKFITPINITGAMEICDVNIIFVGENVPCVKKETMIATYESRVNSKYTDIGTLDLGYVCHAPIQAIPNVTDPDADTIRIEAIARITRENTLAVNDQVWLSATVRNNDDQIYVSQVAVDVAADFTQIVGNETGVQFLIDYNMTETLINWEIGKIYTVPIVVTIPPYSVVKLLVDASMPVNDTAVMSVAGLRLTGAGANLACLMKDKDLIIPFFNSSQGTCQNDKGFMDFGIVTNTGVRYRVGTPVINETLDNSLSMEMDVRINDAFSNIDMAAHKLSIGAKIDKTIIIQDKQIVLKRTNNEKPELELTAAINETLSSVSSLVIEALLMHSNLSSADAHNVSVFFYFPLILAYDRVVSTNHSAAPTVQVIRNYGVAFSWTRLMFCDVVAFTFELKSSPLSSVPSSVQTRNASIPFEVECQMQYRDNSVHASGDYFVVPLDSLSYKVIGPKISGCNTSLNFAGVSDCQISAPASPHTGHEATQARLTGQGFIMHGRRGTAHPRYLQVYFGNRVKVTAVELVHPSVTGLQRVATFKLQSSSDGYNWKDGPTVSTSGSYTSEKVSLPSAVEGRYIRLVVLTSSGSQNTDVGFKVEFYGCTLSSDVASADVCKWKPSWWKTPHAEFNKRTFLVDSSDTLFTCDVIDQAKSKMKCFSLSGGKWTGLDSTAVNVIGYSPTYGEHYGIAWDKATFISSDDSGLTWRSISYTRWQKVKSEGVTVGKAVPWLCKNVLQPGSEPKAEYQSRSYGAGHGGIYKKVSGSWTQVSDWDN